MNEAHNELQMLATTQMPFGKHRGKLLIDLPEDYIVWFQSQGFPDGQIGRLLGLLYEIQLNGLVHLVDPLKANQHARF